MIPALARIRAAGSLPPKAPSPQVWVIDSWSITESELCRVRGNLVTRSSGSPNALEEGEGETPQKHNTAAIIGLIG